MQIGADLRAAAVEGLHRDLESRALGAEERVLREADVLEHDLGGVGGPLAELVLHAVLLDAGKIGRKHEAEMPCAAASGPWWRTRRTSCATCRSR